MEVNEIVLTDCDRQILQSYTCFAEGLSYYLGKSCEIVIHSLESFDHSAIKVIHGFHTGRKEGAPITNIALSMLARIHEEEETVYGIPYFTKNSAGAPLKSTTIPIRGEHSRIIGLVCINFYMNTPLSDILGLLSGDADAADVKEHFTGNTSEWILETIEDIRGQVHANPLVAAQNRNKEIIHRLNQEGIFNLKDSVLIVSRALNISKNTVYLHLRNQTE